MNTLLVGCVVVLGSLALVERAAHTFSSRFLPPPSRVSPFGATPVKGYVLAWRDEFNGKTLDANQWDYRTDSKRESTQLASNVTLAGGYLTLNLRKQVARGKDYTGAGVISRKAYRYGYYEARLKTPGGSGWHTSFWLARNSKTFMGRSYEPSIEIDVIENDSQKPTTYLINTHQWFPGPHRSFGAIQVRTPALNERFHVFGCEFTPTVLRFFFDGRLVQSIDATKLKHGDVSIWLTSIAYRLGKTEIDEAALPDKAQFDYIRFFERDMVAVGNGVRRPSASRF